MRLLRLQLAVLRSFRITAGGSDAYLDPGTGSMILQVILGGVAGAAVAVKMFWHRIMAIVPFGSRQSDDGPSTEN